ncbi:unnamed protein product [Enterobius vermicularis]|uniref:Secreted protein n=1 Tax=Enterobius vermicularis TaxID=51028 RepID=A0A0N4VM98_ENTVE|nr:unnamed protein product [Enterobius vermicularis]
MIMMMGTMMEMMVKTMEMVMMLAFALSSSMDMRVEIFGISQVFSGSFAFSVAVGGELFVCHIWCALKVIEEQLRG